MLMKIVLHTWHHNHEHFKLMFQIQHNTCQFVKHKMNGTKCSVMVKFKIP